VRPWLRRMMIVGASGLLAFGLALFAYNLFGFVSHTVLWREPERLGIAVGVLVVVVGVLLYRGVRP
jgi:hypothetical protein